jgi:hypothetical protein
MTLGVGVQGMPTIKISSSFLTTMTAGSCRCKRRVDCARSQCYLGVVKVIQTEDYQYSDPVTSVLKEL